MVWALKLMTRAQVSSQAEGVSSARWNLKKKSSCEAGVRDAERTVRGKRCEFWSAKSWRRQVCRWSCAFQMRMIRCQVCDVEFRNWCWVRDLRRECVFFRNRIVTRIYGLQSESKVLPCTRCFWWKLPSGICGDYKMRIEYESLASVSHDVQLRDPDVLSVKCKVWALEEELWIVTWVNDAVANSMYDADRWPSLSPAQSTMTLC